MDSIVQSIVTALSVKKYNANELSLYQWYRCWSLEEVFLWQWTL